MSYEIIDKSKKWKNLNKSRYLCDENSTGKLKNWISRAKSIGIGCISAQFPTWHANLDEETCFWNEGLGYVIEL